MLFDTTGRRVPESRDHAADVVKQTMIQQPMLDYGSWMKPLPGPLGAFPRPTAADLNRRAFKMQWALRQESACANLLKGVCLPIYFPRIDIEDYGTVLDTVFLRSVACACQEVRKGPKLKNYMAGRLAHRIALAPDTRHAELLSRMRKKFVVGLFFPLAFHGFSALATRAYIEALPPNFLVAGGLDTAVAMTMYPEAMFSRHGLSFTMPGIEWEDNQTVLYFMRYGAEVTGDIGRRPHACSGDFTAGLLVIEESDH